MIMHYARPEEEQRAHAPKPFYTGEKFSMICAISLTGIMAMMYIEDSVNGYIFKEFIEKFLISKLRKGQFVIFDNVNFHKQQEVVNLIEGVWAKVVFLPPYSPDLPPIEKVWSKIKEILHRKKPRTKAEFHSALAS